MGAVNALIPNGALSRLRDPQLKRILGNTQAQVEDARETELGARRVAAEVIMPLFWQEPELASSLARGREFRGRGRVDGSVGALHDLRQDLALAVELLGAEIDGM